MRIAVLAVLLLVTGCAVEPGAQRECATVFAPPGIKIDVAAGVASMTALTLDVCWNGSCRTYPVPLSATTTAADQTCAAVMCAVPLRQTGGKQGFAGIADLPASPVEVTAAGHTTQVTPRLVHPGGPSCPGSPQAGLVLDKTGLHPR